MQIKREPRDSREEWRGRKREDENIKETVAGRLSVFAAHQRGLRQGLAGKDKPTETQSAKSKKFLRHCLESLTRGTANNKEENLDPHTRTHTHVCFPAPKNINSYLNNLMLF